MSVKPAECTNEMLDYLDDLRRSGETNMFGAAPYLESEYPELSRSAARSVLSYWMETFGEPRTEDK